MVVQAKHEKVNQDDTIVKVLLVGDRGVGKTSLIHTLVNDGFDSDVPAKMENVVIPAAVTPEQVPLHIFDYSEREQNYEDLKRGVDDANVICILYYDGQSESLDRVASHWLPTIRNCQSIETKSKYKPVILVASKVDLLEDAKPLNKVTQILQDFIEIETFIEVSALSQKNVVELFYAAQKAVIYPLEPLFDTQTRALSKKCKSALINIFKLCDHDNDGMLSDHELNLFQENCFGTPLQKDALDDLKSIIEQSTTNGVVNNKMTQVGFLFLHTLSIDKGRHDFTWQVLKKFNYDKQINYVKNEKPNESILNGSFSGSLNDLNNRRLMNLKSDGSKQHNESIEHYELPWFEEHSTIIKAGVGISVATFLGMLALKYLFQSSIRNSV